MLTFSILCCEIVSRLGDPVSSEGAAYLNSHLESEFSEGRDTYSFLPGQIGD